MKIRIDNGHGIETLGKRSPDGRLREYAYTREVADRVVKALTAAGIDAVRIVPEDADVPLSERCTRANALYTESGKQAILVSIHCNAAGNGSAWMSAHGWSVFVDTTASQNSKRLATALADVAESKVVTVRKQAGGRNWKSHATLTLLVKQDLPTFGYNMIVPLKSWCWGAILFYPFKISRFS